MNLPKMLVLACVLALTAAAPTQAAPRQFYSKYWQKKGGYYYRTYYYKPALQAPAYRYNLVVYYPSKPRYYYYYNPYKERYWGRYDREKEGYSKLAEKDQRAKVTEIEASAFPEPGALPAVPDSEDGVKMEAPPKGLPVDESEEISQETMKDVLGKEAKEAPRQCYSTWCKQDNYYYCCYYYQPAAGAAYKSHRAIYYPTRSYVYYYNPYKSKYWGRYDLEAKGYSLLAEKDQSEKLTSIPPSAFPKPGEMPAVPESADKLKMLRPPTELPTN